MVKFIIEGMAKDSKRFFAKKKVAEATCEFCGEEKPLCYVCRKCGFTLCAECLVAEQKKFVCASAVAWICPNCGNWETL
ncbi:MAG: hypothetical protein LM575_00400 [Caldimicrobium sp.]|nr:hypothetical protein [Caldimicrobium sp.]MCC6048365.1 hypothetical protein [Thermodesulfobacterium sp.]